MPAAIPDTPATAGPDAGATPEEVMAVLECVAVLGIHSVALGAPMLVEEMKARGLSTPAAG